MDHEVEVRQVCPDCGRLELAGGWRGRVDSLEMGYVGPASDMPLFGRPHGHRIDVHVPCPACLARRAGG